MTLIDLRHNYCLTIHALKCVLTDLLNMVCQGHLENTYMGTLQSAFSLNPHLSLSIDQGLLEPPVGISVISSSLENLSLQSLIPVSVARPLLYTYVPPSQLLPQMNK